ncbi:hypothetical protein BCR33DRAFT_788206 [Rhizoclosmatium globosum]|uniref:Uncharacterized protein n=1 Tax=Rhizoclosmatium globosum TaxID=329046 RepID=A0A1Y2BXS5_9FUNG|nr:hypothetical protein BCR33DRAFT_788206 [Rhizoclosmatium globosum]|eukprot:ORY39572.1 hypothetical protein BCR33DRAFT_788206 [Rhizoclosmatium globosum]
MSDELRDSFPNNRISIASVWEILKTTAFLLKREYTSFVGKWDVFCLMQLVNERLEGIPIVAERDRVARNGIGLLVVLASDTLDSPLLLQLLLSLVLKFLGSDIKFLSKVILGIMAGTRVVKSFKQSRSRSKQRIKSLLRCLEALIKSLQQFHQIQTLSLIFIDATNSSFAPIFEKYGHLLETPSDFSELVEEAIEYSILGAEEAIVKFISMCLESGKPL